MFRTLSALLATWVRSLRTIADLHPAIFSVGDWSTPREAHRHDSMTKTQAMRLDAEHPIADTHPQPTAEQRPVEPAASTLIVKRFSSN